MRKLMCFVKLRSQWAILISRNVMQNCAGLHEEFDPFNTQIPSEAICNFNVV